MRYLKITTKVKNTSITTNRLRDRVRVLIITEHALNVLAINWNSSTSCKVCILYIGWCQIKENRGVAQIIPNILYIGWFQIKENRGVAQMLLNILYIGWLKIKENECVAQTIQNIGSQGLLNVLNIRVWLLYIRGRIPYAKEIKNLWEKKTKKHYDVYCLMILDFD